MVGAGLEEDWGMDEHGQSKSDTHSPELWAICPYGMGRLKAALEFLVLLNPREAH